MGCNYESALRMSTQKNLSKLWATMSPSSSDGFPYLQHSNLRARITKFGPSLVALGSKFLPVLTKSGLSCSCFSKHACFGNFCPMCFSFRLTSVQFVWTFLICFLNKHHSENWHVSFLKWARALNFHPGPEKEACFGRGQLFNRSTFCELHGHWPVLSHCVQPAHANIN